MGMSAVARHWTREEVLALPDDGNRYELVDGELLVSPAPRWRHQRAVGQLFLWIAQYLEDAHFPGTVLFSPADLDLDAGHLVQPDLFVVGEKGCAVREWTDVHIPLLVAEVLSPSTARHDRVTKRRLYQRAGVPTCWIVDLDARLVEVWTPGADRPVIADQDITWQPDGEVPPLRIDLPAYSRAVWGE